MECKHVENEIKNKRKQEKGKKKETGDEVEANAKGSDPHPNKQISCVLFSQCLVIIMDGGVCDT